jgi:hypothetical protein
MKRRGFFGTIAAVIGGISVAKAKPKFEVKSNYKMWETGATMPYKNMGILIPAPTPVPKNTLEAKGWLRIEDGYVTIDCFKNSTRIGDIIATDKVHKLRVCSVTSLPIILPTGDRTMYQYQCKQLQSPKRICDRPVIMIDGKWRQFKKDDRSYEITFMPIMSAYSEGGVSS